MTTIANAARAAAATLHAGDAVDLSEHKVCELAAIIVVDWQRPYFGAKPYIEAMACLVDIDDAYGAEDGRSVVAYALGNFTTWRGPVARAVKAELKRRLG